MIPDHIIDKAARAFHESSTFNVVAWDRLGKNTVTRTMPRKYSRAILEAVAADIWDQGFKEGRDYGYDFRMAENWNDEYPPEPASPYRPEESA